MIISIRVNNVLQTWDVAPSDTLLDVLRRNGFFGAKFGGCVKGECGNCTVLFDGKPVNSCTMLAAQAEGHSVETIEAMGQHPEKGWKASQGLHVIQQAFVESGAIQCGYCTPAMVLASKSLLDRTLNPTEAQIREVLSGILCRCTGYVKPVQAIQRAAAVLRGEEVFPVGEEAVALPSDWLFAPPEENGSENLPVGKGPETRTRLMPRMMTTPQTSTWQTVGKPEPKVDAIKLVQGKPAFAADFEMRGMLIAKVLHSPVAHARIKKIDVSKASELPGVAAVLTHRDIPRVAYSTAGQSDPIPGPLDTFSLDNKVRFVGDRVAFVAAETEEIANKALGLIEVEYEELPALLDSSDAMKDGAVIIHDEPDYVNFDRSDPKRNLAAAIRIDVGDVEKGFAEADHIFEADYEVPKVQQASIEPHIVITYWDEDDRLVMRTSTQVPFHTRRILAPVLKLPLKRIRVIKPRIGGGFGGKQEVLHEDVAAHLTIVTGRPVMYEYTREEEFIAARSRHPMKLHMKTGVKKDGTITANEMYCLTDKGAYGCHALTVTGNTGHKSMALYVGDGPYRKSPNIRFYADIVYTNHPPAGAFRGYGGPQGFWAVERHMEKIARDLGLDPIEFRLKNALRSGELQPFSTAWSEGREPSPETILTNGLEECVRQAKAAIGWDQKYDNPDWHIVPGKPHLRRGIGTAFAMHGTAIPYLDLGGASIKMNEDGSFNMLVGATDLGTGSDTVLAQMAAEVIGTSIEDIIVYSSDTDITPFDKGAYASSTTYISGAAVTRAAEQVAERIRIRGARLINERLKGAEVHPHQINLMDGKAIAPDGRFVTLSDIGHHSLHHTDQEQIMGVASYVSKVSPPPFGAQFADITVDIETGQIVVDNLVMAVDAGVIVNPLTASGQVEGGMTQALGYGVCEEMRYDEKGVPIERDFVDYHIFRADEMPHMETLFVETFEPSHPYGVKAVAEIVLDGVAPAVANAIVDACNAQVDHAPATPREGMEGFTARRLMSDGLDTTPIYVVGHVNPDTDSIAAAMGYAWLLRERDGIKAVAARAGACNPQTTWALKYLSFDQPKLLTDASPRFESVSRRYDTSHPNRPLREAWAIANRTGGVAPLINDDGTPYGIINGKSMFNFFSRLVGSHPRQQEVRVSEILELPSNQAADTSIHKFQVSTRIRDVINRILRDESDEFWVLDDAGRYAGICRQRDLINPPRLKIILVDHNESQQALASLDDAELIEILDHHRLGNPSTHTPIRFTVDVVGSTSTLVSERIENDGLSAPPNFAGILLAGLLADTLILTSPTTTTRDHQAAQRLARWACVGGTVMANETIKSFGEKLLAAGAGLGAREPGEIVVSDMKQYQAGGYHFAISQVEVSDFYEVTEYLDGLKKALTDLRTSNGLDFAILMVTNVVKRSSRLILSNPPPLLDDLPYPPMADRTLIADDVVSRKKQLLPVLFSLLEA